MEILAAAAVVGGAGLSAYSTLEGGKEAADMGKLTQEQLNEEAKAAEQAGNYESREKRKEAARAKAGQIAQISANGGLLTGSNLVLVADTAKEYESDAIVIARNYKMEASRLRIAGSMAAYEGKQIRRASRVRAASDFMKTAGMAAGSANGPAPKSNYSSANAKAASTGSGAYKGTGGGGPTGGGSRSMIG